MPNLLIAQWELVGNSINATEYFGADNTSSIPVSFEHRANHANSQFRWFTHNGTAFSERMRLTRTGWLGLNTTTPLMRFHVLDGGILSSGTTGTNPDMGAGTRLMWIPDRAAFRAGRVGTTGGSVTWWDGINVGIGSAAFGTNNLASGTNSFAAGFGNEVTGELAVAFGNANEATGDNSQVIGNTSEASGEFSIAIGRSNLSAGDNCVGIGFRNELMEDNSYSKGQGIISEAENNITLGMGNPTAGSLLNDIPFSLMIGLNSNVSTLFVGTSDGTADSFGSVGIGNITAPTEVLDVNGTARLRIVPTATPDVLITGVEADDEGDYVLNHLEFSGTSNEFLAGDGTWQTVNTGADCDWELVNTDLDIVMGFDDACVVRAVGIGTPTPRTKLQVDFHGDLPEGFDDVAIDATVRTANNQQTTERIAVRGRALNEEDESINDTYGGYFTAHGSNKVYGLFAEAFRTTTNNISPKGVVGKAAGVSATSDNMGVQGLASNSEYNYGVRGEATYASILGGPAPARNFGVYGYACGATQNYGVYGTICQGSSGYAGYFDGPIYASSSPWVISDASLKQNIESFENALDVISQLQPKTYEFVSNPDSDINLPQGPQIGLISQELEEVLPNLVRSTIHPGTNDEEGNVIHHDLEFKAVNYSGLIPVLIAGMKEQQTIIESQNEVLAQMMEQLANMQQQINDCCNSGEGNKSMPGGAFQPQDLNIQKSLDGGNELFQNIPNPFRESTTISYSLEEGGRVQLSIYDKTGKVVTTLTDANQGPGRYSEVWNANGMPSGVYHYALYVNGELLVKRAIKLQE
jgi:hypothetical protein